MDELKAFAIFGCVLSPFLIVVGILMRKYDFSAMFNHPFGKKDGLYIRSGLKLKKISENSTENRTKYSKMLGSFFIGISLTFLLFCLFLLLQ